MVSRAASRIAIGAIIASACVTVLTACQQDGMRPQLTLTPGYGLHFIDEGDKAKLAYGMTNSDNVALMLECAKGSRNIEITDVARGDNRKLMLKSGATRSDFGGVIVPGPSPVLTASGKVDTPALKAFRETGQIEVQTGDRRYGVTASGAEHAEVKRFFAVCERA